jgi:protein phosphatase
MSENQLILLVGISGAGKSTFADKYLAEHPDVKYLSSDKIRGILGTSEDDQTVTPQVFGLIKRNLDEYLKAGKSVMIDATSLNAKERKDYLIAASKYNVDAIAYVFERTRDQLIKNQEKRKANGGRRVPDEILDRMLNKYKRPTHSEGFKEILFV